MFVSYYRPIYTHIRTCIHLQKKGSNTYCYSLFIRISSLQKKAFKWDAKLHSKCAWALIVLFLLLFFFSFPFFYLVSTEFWGILNLWHVTLTQSSHLILLSSVFFVVGGGVVSFVSFIDSFTLLWFIFKSLICFIVCIYFNVTPFFVLSLLLLP